MLPQGLLDEFIESPGRLFDDISLHFNMLLLVQEAMLHLFLFLDQRFYFVDHPFVPIERYYLFELLFGPRLSHGKSVVPLSPLLYDSVLFSLICLILRLLLLLEVRLELLVGGLAGEFILLNFSVVVNFINHGLLVLLSELVRQLLHLNDRLGFLSPHIFLWEVPEYILLIVSTVNDSPEVEPVRPDSHLAIFRNGDETVEIVLVNFHN